MTDPNAPAALVERIQGQLTGFLDCDEVRAFVARKTDVGDTILLHQCHYDPVVRSEEHATTITTLTAEVARLEAEKTRLEAELAKAREGLRAIKIEAERETGRLIHLRRVIALHAHAVFTTEARDGTD